MPINLELILCLKDNGTIQRPSGIVPYPGSKRMFQLPDRIILQHSGLDAFFFLRYIRTFLTIFTSLLVVIIPCLVPLKLLGGNDVAGGTQGLDRYSGANIGLDHTAFYWAHLLMALLVIVFICYTIYVELLFYVHVRNLYLVSRAHRLSEAANTILVTDIPEENLPVLKDVYSIFPGGVHSVWINRDFSALSKKIEERKTLVATLEAAETSLLSSATKSFRQRKNHELAQSSGADTEKERPLWRRYLKEKDRDHMYISRQGCNWMPAIPLIGKRVDTIYHCLGELAQMNKEIGAEVTELAKVESNGRESSKYPRKKSVFIRFNTQSAVSNPPERSPSALIRPTYQRFLAGIEMEHSKSTMVESIYREWVGVDRHRFSSHNVGDTRRIHGLPVPNYYLGRLCIVASLDIWRSGLAEWDYSRCAAAVDVSSTERIVAAGPTHYHGLARSVNGNDNKLSLQKYYFVFLFSKFSSRCCFHPVLRPSLKNSSMAQNLHPHCWPETFPRRATTFFSTSLYKVFW